MKLIEKYFWLNFVCGGLCFALAIFGIILLDLNYTTEKCLFSNISMFCRCVSLWCFLVPNFFIMLILDSER